MMGVMTGSYVSKSIGVRQFSPCGRIDYAIGIVVLDLTICDFLYLILVVIIRRAEIMQPFRYSFHFVDTYSRSNDVIYLFYLVVVSSLITLQRGRQQPSFQLAPGRSLCRRNRCRSPQTSGWWAAGWS